jgi:hypothetical protein
VSWDNGVTYMFFIKILESIVLLAIYAYWFRGSSNVVEAESHEMRQTYVDHIHHGSQTWTTNYEILNCFTSSYLFSIFV